MSGAASELSHRQKLTPALPTFAPMLISGLVMYQDGWGSVVAFPPITTPATPLSDDPDVWSSAGSGKPISWPLDSDVGPICQSGPRSHGTEWSENESWSISMHVPGVFAASAEPWPPTATN